MGALVATLALAQSACSGPSASHRPSVTPNPPSFRAEPLPPGFNGGVITASGGIAWVALRSRGPSTPGVLLGFDEATGAVLGRLPVGAFPVAVSASSDHLAPHGVD